jgi:prepilin peptidase CpaA
MPAPFPAPLQCALIAVVLTAAVYDFRFRKIPNWVNACGVVLGFGLNVLFFGLHGLVLASEGLLLGFAVYLPLYLLRGMGAGDVKLMAAIGALAGPGNWFEIFIGTAFVGGAAAAVYALIKGRFNETCWNLVFILKDLARLRAPHRNNPHLSVRNEAALRMPHGVSIAIGALVFLGVLLTLHSTPSFFFRQIAR